MLLLTATVYPSHNLNHFITDWHHLSVSTHYKVIITLTLPVWPQDRVKWIGLWQTAMM